MKHALLITEGSTDEAVIAGILRNSLGFKLNQRRDTLWNKLLEGQKSEYPVLVTDEWSVLVLKARGGVLGDGVFSLIRNEAFLRKLATVGILADRDDGDLKKRERAIGDGYRKLELYAEEFRDFPSSHAEIRKASRAQGSSLSMGFYLFPDDKRQGSLEHLLLDAARAAFPSLEQAASQFVEKIWEEHGDKKGLFTREKAQVSAMGAVLKPEYSAAVSLHDSRWYLIGKEFNPSFTEVRKFLTGLLDLPASTSESTSS